MIHNNLSKDVPKFDIELLFDEIGVLLDDNQYRDAISLVDMYHFYTRQHQVSACLLFSLIAVDTDPYRALPVLTYLPYLISFHLARSLSGATHSIRFPWLASPHIRITLYFSTGKTHTHRPPIESSVFRLSRSPPPVSHLNFDTNTVTLRNRPAY